jgi:TIR domain
MSTPPTCFISYSWDDDAHNSWVHAFASRLRNDGVETVLDKWHAMPGDQLPEFMERGIRENDFVLLICTPRYRAKADGRAGGVGYEGDITTGEVFVKKNHRKFIAIRRSGSWEDSAPSFLIGTYRIDLHGEPYSETNYKDLLDTLLNQREVPPPVSVREDNGIPQGKIILPHDGGLVPRLFRTSGTIEKLPPNFHVYLAIGIGPLIWPKDSSIVIEDNFWSSEVLEAGLKGEFSLSLDAVNNECHQEIVAWLESGMRTGYYPAFRELSGGIILHKINLLLRA